MRHLFQYKPVRVPVACMMAVTHAQTVALSTRLLEGALNRKGDKITTHAHKKTTPPHTHIQTCKALQKVLNSRLGSRFADTNQFTTSMCYSSPGGGGEVRGLL